MHAASALPVPGAWCRAEPRPSPRLSRHQLMPPTGSRRCSLKPLCTSILLAADGFAAGQVTVGKLGAEATSCWRAVPLPTGTQHTFLGPFMPLQLPGQASDPGGNAPVGARRSYYTKDCAPSKASRGGPMKLQQGGGANSIRRQRQGSLHVRLNGCDHGFRDSRNREQRCGVAQNMRGGIRCASAGGRR